MQEFPDVADMPRPMTPEEIKKATQNLRHLPTKKKNTDTGRKVTGYIPTKWEKNLQTAITYAYATGIIDRPTQYSFTTAAVKMLVNDVIRKKIGSQRLSEG